MGRGYRFGFAFSLIIPQSQQSLGGLVDERKSSEFQSVRAVYLKLPSEIFHIEQGGRVFLSIYGLLGETKFQAKGPPVVNKLLQVITLQHIFQRLKTCLLYTSDAADE